MAPEVPPEQHWRLIRAPLHSSKHASHTTCCRLRAAVCVPLRSAAQTATGAAAAVAAYSRRRWRCTHQHAPALFPQLQARRRRPRQQQQHSQRARRVCGRTQGLLPRCQRRPGCPMMRATSTCACCGDACCTGQPWACCRLLVASPPQARQQAVAAPVVGVAAARSAAPPAWRQLRRARCPPAAQSHGAARDTANA